MENRIKILSQYVEPAYFAYKDREDNNGLTEYKFRVVGGGRMLEFCKWNEKAVNNLSKEEFDKILSFLKVRDLLLREYDGLTLLDFLNYIESLKNGKQET